MTKTKAVRVKKHKEFRSQTEPDIVYQYTRWFGGKLGRVFDVKRHPIERLPLNMQPGGFQVEAPNTFLMRVDYEEEEVEKPTPRRRTKKPVQRRSRKKPVRRRRLKRFTRRRR